MKQKENSWEAYFINRSKNLAIGIDQNSPVAYGTEVYSSPRQPDYRSGTISLSRWLVMEWQGEFNVFLERTGVGSRKNISLVASFNSKEKSIKFALEMCLICNGKLNRKKTIFG